MIGNTLHPCDGSHTLTSISLPSRDIKNLKKCHYVFAPYWARHLNILTFKPLLWSCHFFYLSTLHHAQGAWSYCKIRSYLVNCFHEESLYWADSQKQKGVALEKNNHHKHFQHIPHGSDSLQSFTALWTFNTLVWDFSLQREPAHIFSRTYCYLMFWTFYIN